MSTPTTKVTKISSPPLVRKSWSKAGLLKDKMLSQSGDNASPPRYLPLSRLQYLLDIPSAPLHDKVRRVLEIEQECRSQSPVKARIRPSFYFKSPSRFELSRAAPQSPGVGYYNPQFDFGKPKSRALVIRKSVIRRDSEDSKIWDCKRELTNVTMDEKIGKPRLSMSRKKSLQAT